MRRLLPLLLSFPLSASTLSTSTSASVGQFPFLAIGGQTGTTKSSVSLTGSYGEVDAQAAATYGSVRVNAFAETDGTKATALADTSFTDTIQLFGTGTATFTAQVNGYANRPDSGSSQARIKVFTAFAQCECPNPCPTILTGQIALDGVFQIDAFATAETDVSAPGDVSSAAFAGFSITSITLTDAQGNLIAGVPYLSESGTAYLQDEVLVPEPGTWLLLFGGLFMLVINRGRRVQSAEFTKQRRQCSTLLGSLGSTWPLILEFIFSKNFPTNATDQWFQTNTAHDIF